MQKKLFIPLISVALLLTAASLLADPPTVSTADKLSVDARIDQLMKLSPAERRVEMKKMAPEDRRGLWFQLKRRQAEAKAGQAGTYTNRVMKQPGQSAARIPIKAPGTIQYDDGVVTTSFNTTNAILGNRFNTADGSPVTASGTVDTVVAVVVQGSAFTTSSAGFVLEGPQTGGGGAMALQSTFTAGSGGPTDTVTFAGLGVSYTGSSFFVLFGAFNNSYVPAFGSGTTNGQGHHGVRGNTGGMGPNITGTTDLGGMLNALVRVTGNVLPVELMSFDAE